MGKFRVLAVCICIRIQAAWNPRGLQRQRAIRSVTSLFSHYYCSL